MVSSRRRPFPRHRRREMTDTTEKLAEEDEMNSFADGNLLAATVHQIAEKDHRVDKSDDHWLHFDDAVWERIAREYALKLRAAHSAQGVGDGWVLVPREPTPEMCAAATTHFGDSPVP